jgi:hypothetical protein
MQKQLKDPLNWKLFCLCKNRFGTMLIYTVATMNTRIVNKLATTNDRTDELTVIAIADAANVVRIMSR